MKKIKKRVMLFLIVFAICFTSLTIIYTFKDNLRKTDLAKQTIEILVDSWKKQDMDKVSLLAGEESTFLNVQTGFEKYEDINTILNEHIYNEVECEIKDIHINMWNLKEEQTGQVKLVIKTYNNLEVLDCVIKSLVTANSKVDKDYTHTEFIKENISRIKKEISEIQKEYSKIVIVSMKYDEIESKWTVPYKDNEDFYIALSGDILLMKEKINLIK